ncbi:hypothetical protein HANVADRAFT_52083 [Hanseniaspora valbyensis NRRL Y-1626]|uniref:Cell wall mannoprotein PIR1-like C-terminal domain-containing protein n=1 Tax=Hanseniaspora valbyensis NRRL Y-1626 TaxID=766949 RepID=A0A1B7TFW6_9ASCO|nr:hypothetical protein HANVADRAFT_52083 [Hanseniaspora valbyensis NRRL Y-1626]
MQIKNLILSTLLAIEGVSAASHSHSSGSSKTIPTTVISSSTTSSSAKSSSSSTSSNSTYIPGQDWETLTPANTYQCGFTNFTSTFGVAVKTVTLDISNSTTNQKRDLVAPTQAVDVLVGQVKAFASITGGNSDETVATTTLTRTKTIVSTSVATLAVNATALNETAASFKYTANLTVNGTLVNTTFSNVSLYGNSSLLNSTVLNSTATYLNQTHQGNTTSYNSTLVSCNASLPEFFESVSCQTNSTLSVTLENGILRDSSEKIGSIVSSHQFQFNGPWPAEGTLFAAGWSITPESTLALGANDIFYECLSGDGYYNLFNEFVGSDCIPIQLEVVSLIEC